MCALMFLAHLLILRSQVHVTIYEFHGPAVVGQTVTGMPIVETPFIYIPKIGNAPFADNGMRRL